MTSFKITFQLSEMVYWNDEYNDDGFFANKHLQLLVNHLYINFPICYLYSTYLHYQGRRKGFFTYRNELYGIVIFLDFTELYQFDQLDIITLGIKVPNQFSDFTRNQLKLFLNDTENQIGNSLNECDSELFEAEIKKNSI